MIAVLIIFIPRTSLATSVCAFREPNPTSRLLGEVHLLPSPFFSRASVHRLRARKRSSEVPCNRRPSSTSFLAAISSKTRFICSLLSRLATYCSLAASLNSLRPARICSKVRCRDAATSCWLSAIVQLTRSPANRASRISPRADRATSRSTLMASCASLTAAVIRCSSAKCISSTAAYRVTRRTNVSIAAALSIAPSHSSAVWSHASSRARRFLVQGTLAVKASLASLDPGPHPSLPYRRQCEPGLPTAHGPPATFAPSPPALCVPALSPQASNGSKNPTHSPADTTLLRPSIATTPRAHPTTNAPHPPQGPVDRHLPSAPYKRP